MFPPLCISAKPHFLFLLFIFPNIPSEPLSGPHSLNGPLLLEGSSYLTLYSGWTSRLEEVLLLWAESFESCSISSRRGASGAPPDKTGEPRGPPP